MATKTIQLITIEVQNMSISIAQVKPTATKEDEERQVHNIGKWGIGKQVLMGALSKG